MNRNVLLFRLRRGGAHLPNQQGISSAAAHRPDRAPAQRRTIPAQRLLLLDSVVLMLIGAGLGFFWRSFVDLMISAGGSLMHAIGGLL